MKLVVLGLCCQGPTQTGDLESTKFGGRTPWSAADALVGLLGAGNSCETGGFRGLEPDQGVRRGRGASALRFDTPQPGPLVLKELQLPRGTSA